VQPRRKNNSEVGALTPLPKGRARQYPQHEVTRN